MPLLKRTTPKTAPFAQPRSPSTRWVCVGVIGGLLWQLSGCGTLLYPERRGQTGGQLDTSIILLDGLGLLVFFLPGVISFAVDFATGAIYLPGGRKTQLSPEERDIIARHHHKAQSHNNAPHGNDAQYNSHQYHSHQYHAIAGRIAQQLSEEHWISEPIAPSQHWQVQPLSSVNQWFFMDQSRQ